MKKAPDKPFSHFRELDKIKCMPTLLLISCEQSIRVEKIKPFLVMKNKPLFKISSMLSVIRACSLIRSRMSQNLIFNEIIFVSV